MDEMNKRVEVDLVGRKRVEVLAETFRDTLHLRIKSKHHLNRNTLGWANVSFAYSQLSLVEKDNRHYHLQLHQYVHLGILLQVDLAQIV
jgi:hypothetical protein